MHASKLIVISGHTKKKHTYQAGNNATTSIRHLLGLVQARLNIDCDSMGVGHIL